MLNVAIITGRLSADPELKQTAKGTAVISFTVAVQRAYVKKGEERKTDWIDCVVWGKTAEFVNKYFRKGQLISLQGRLQTRTYEDKNGANQKRTELFAESVDFAGDKTETKSAPADTVSTAKDIPEYLYSEDDLPF